VAQVQPGRLAPPEQAGALVPLAYSVEWAVPELPGLQVVSVVLVPLALLESMALLALVE
jgi:hypothetical protein